MNFLDSPIFHEEFKGQTSKGFKGPIEAISEQIFGLIRGAEDDLFGKCFFKDLRGRFADLLQVDEEFSPFFSPFPMAKSFELIIENGRGIPSKMEIIAPMGSKEIFCRAKTFPL